jgi:hypothetical protein
MITVLQYKLLLLLLSIYGGERWLLATIRCVAVFYIIIETKLNLTFS